jgi:hypothetical protein
MYVVIFEYSISKPDCTDVIMIKGDHFNDIKSREKEAGLFCISLIS